MVLSIIVYTTKWIDSPFPSSPPALAAATENIWSEACSQMGTVLSADTQAAPDLPLAAGARHGAKAWVLRSRVPDWYYFS